MSRLSLLAVTIACAIIAIAVRRLWIQQDLTSNGDTTAVILNWSRLANVVKIVSVLCQPQLQHVVSRIFIWNNSPQEVNYSTFAESKCPNSRLRFYNSPNNLYFQARFFACRQSQTQYCFIQDDDYLIWPEIIQAMRSRIHEASASAIHLLPPHEMLSSQLRTISAGSRIHTSFAWLGHGTIMPRTMAVDFISLLHHLNATEETLKMADNYFTIMMNTVPETWFDHGMELGGGQPFTVGAEGDERNKRHITLATKMLDSLLREDEDDTKLPLLSTTEYTIPAAVSRTPCLRRVCIFETSIPLLPPEIKTEVSMAEEMLDNARMNFEILSNKYKQHYLNHPPSHAVDGQHDTCFRSPANANEGEWISLDLVDQLLDRPITINVIVDGDTEAILSSSVIEVYADEWIPLTQQMSCELYSTSALRLCKTTTQNRRIRLRLRWTMDKRWTVCEMWASV